MSITNVSSEVRLGLECVEFGIAKAESGLSIIERYFDTLSEPAKDKIQAEVVKHLTEAKVFMLYTKRLTETGLDTMPMEDSDRIYHDAQAEVLNATP